jgi:hypothetical protein
MIDKYKDKANKLLLLLDQTKSYDLHNRFTKMCLFFQSKQSEHIHNIIILEPSHDYYLLVRSMIEGLCMLEYANTNGEYYAECWEESFLIKDIQFERIKTEQGFGSTPNIIQELEDLVSCECVNLLADKKSQKTISVGEKSYYKEWYKELSISQIIKKCSDKTLYVFWSEYSAWHHWEPNGFMKAIYEKEDITYYKEINEKDTIKALAIGIVCLMRTIEITLIELKDTESLSKYKLIMDESLLK